MNTQQAFKTFVEALTASRHLADGSLRSNVGAITLRHWQRHKDGRTTRHDEALAQGCEPAEVLQALRACQPAPEHYITVLDDRPDTMTAYEAAGYRCTVTEYLMTLDLQVPPFEAPDRSVRLATEHDLPWLLAADPEPRAWVSSASVAHPSVRNYFIRHGDDVGARGFNWLCDSSSSYVSHLFTHPRHRRQGLGRALMRRLLADSRLRGERWSVLVSSEEGHALYRSLGYQTLGRIGVFEPRGTP